jgi:sec-independent protein translocase protein TatB
LVAGLFIIGPERLPAAMKWLGSALARGRGMVASASDQITSEMRPEFEELRKPLQDLYALRTLDPRAAVTKFLLEDETIAASAPAKPASPASAGNTVSQVDMEAT